MRLAETFHRRPTTVDSTTASPLEGLNCTAPQIVLLHTFQTEDGSVALRALNASEAPCEATLTWPCQFKSVTIANLDGAPLDSPTWTHTNPGDVWTYRFRPWEIATFQVSAP